MLSPVTTPGLTPTLAAMEISVAPVTLHESCVLSPVLTVPGEAANAVITGGGGFTVTAMVRVTAPAEFLACRV